MKPRLLTATAIAVLTVLWAAGTAGAQTRVTWGNASGSNSGQYALDGVSPTISAGNYSGTVWECPTTCNVDSVLVTIEHNGGDGTPQVFKVAVVAGDYSMIDTTEEVSISANGTAQYQIALLNGFTATAGVLYHLACWSPSAGATTLEWAYSTNVPAYTDSARFDPTTYGGAWPNPLVPTTNIAGRRMVGGFVGFVASSEISPRRRRILSGGLQ